MNVMFRLPHLAGVLLLATTPIAGAESPLPDPIAPAVVGRPLDQIRPARPVREKPVAAKPHRPKKVTASNRAAPARPSAPVATAPARAAVTARPSARVATAPAAVQAVPPSQRLAQHAPAAVQIAPPSQGVAKQALDHRADPGTHVLGGVGEGTRLASTRPAPGAYFSSKDQALVRKYYEAQPVPGRVANWKAGEPVPKRAALTGVPDQLRAALPVLPPGHQYVQLDGEVVLVAVQSRMVVDGVSRSMR